jgi:hypothetical protein
VLVTRVTPIRRLHCDRQGTGVVQMSILDYRRGARATAWQYQILVGKESPTWNDLEPFERLHVRVEGIGADQFRATAKVGEFMKARCSQSF